VNISIKCTLQTVVSVNYQNEYHFSEKCLKSNTENATCYFEVVIYVGQMQCFVSLRQMVKMGFSVDSFEICSTTINNRTVAEFIIYFSIKLHRFLRRRPANRYYGFFSCA